VKIEAIPAPPANPSSVQNCFDKVFEQEIGNTESIYKIVRKSFDEGDWATWHFLQWFVKEQTEEETLALNLLDKIKIAGAKKQVAMRCIRWTGIWQKNPTMQNSQRKKTAINP